MSIKKQDLNFININNYSNNNNNKNKIEIPKDAQKIIEKLNQNNFEAYVVGGFVRDYFLGKVSYDCDIATSAKPHEIKCLFPKTVDTGIKHGTVTVVTKKGKYEVTTFRIDGQYKNNRKPVSVEFTSSIIEDLSRRDFTINSMAYSQSTGLIDPFNGINDLKIGQVKAVGNPNIRFQEDALRMLRAVRFSAQLNFSIEPYTEEAIRNNAHLIQNISSERIREELNKILTSSNPSKFSVLKQTNLLKYIFPEFLICYETSQNHPYHIYNVAEHILKSVEYTENDLHQRWTMLLHDIGKPLVKSTKNGIDHFYNHASQSSIIAEKILKRLKFDNYSINKIQKLIKYHDTQLTPSSASIKKIVNKLGFENFLILLEIKKADIKAQNPALRQEMLYLIEEIYSIFENIIKNKEPVTISDLAIDGHDLINHGFVEGKNIGLILNSLLQKVHANPSLNKKHILLKLAKKIQK